MNLPNLGGQILVIDIPFTGRPFLPVIITAAANAYDIAHPLDPIVTIVLSDKGVLYLRSLAKYAAAFFNMSRSSFTSLSSFLSLAISLN